MSTSADSLSPRTSKRMIHECVSRTSKRIHAPLADLTEYMFSIPGFQAYYTTLEDADSDEHEGSVLEEDRDCSQRLQRQRLKRPQQQTPPKRSLTYEIALRLHSES